MSFAGKVGVVTGGCAGIGFAIVKMFLDHGMEVHLRKCNEITPMKLNQFSTLFFKEHSHFTSPYRRYGCLKLVTKRLQEPKYFVCPSRRS